MNESYDPGTHLLVIALIVFYWQLLRTWQRPPPSDGSSAAGKEAAAGPALKPAGADLKRAAPSQAGSAQEVGGAPAAPEDPLAFIRAADQGFDEKAFLAGAARAYELVVNAYAEGDMEVLDRLLDPQVRDGFKDAIAARVARGEKLGLTFIGIENMRLLRAGSQADVAEVTVGFESQAVVVTYDADGAVVDGEPEKIVLMTDEWTFARSLRSKDPNWAVVST